MRRGTAVWGILGGVVLLAGCQATADKPMSKFAPGMYTSIPYDDYDPNPVLADGSTFLLPPEGSVPVGWSEFPYGPGPEEAQRAGAELDPPYEPTREHLARGRHIWQTYCVVCHGPEGVGDGPVIGAGRFPNPPNLHAERARSLPPGRIYHIVTLGQGVMPGYGAQVLPEDRWMVILWLRELQGGTTAPEQPDQPTPEKAS